MNKLKLKCLIASFVCIAAFSTFNPTHKIKADTTTVGVSYDAHVQNIGWQNPWAKDGGEAGTDGQALRVEALKIKLQNAPAGAKISYQTHVQNIGWQDWVSDGAEAGTDGKSLRVEAIRIKLENMPGYSVQYQAHIENVGWQDWVSDGNEAGTDGKGLRIEAVRIRIVKNVSANSITLNKTSDSLSVGDTDTLSASFNPDNTTNKNIAWSSSDSNIVSIDKNGKITAVAAGNATVTATSEDGKETASCNVTVKASTKEPEVTYQTHVQNIGWQDPVSDGKEAGTEGKSLRIEALKMKLINAPAGAKITYQAHVQNVGWQNWVSDGAEAGTDGQGLRVEAFKIKLENMPGYSVQYQAHVENIGWQNWVNDGEEAGTNGQGLRVEAVRIRIVKTVPIDSISLNKQTDAIIVGNSDTLSATVAPTNGTFVWTSSDSSIADVDASGKVTGIKAGTTTITASSIDGKKTASCSVTVNNPEPSVEYTPYFKSAGWESTVKDGADAGIGGRPLSLQGLKVNLKNAPAGAHIVYDAYTNTSMGEKLESSDGKELLCNGTSYLDGFSMKLENMPGYSIEYQAYMAEKGWTDWVYDGDYTRTTPIPFDIQALRIRIVKAKPAPQIIPIDSINMPTTNYKIAVGDDKFINYSTSPTTPSHTDGISWASYDSSIVSVDDCGHIRGLKEGTATITATSKINHKTASCTVTVGPAIHVNSVTLDKTNITLGINNYDLLNATLNPDNANNKGVSWTSSDESIADVSQNGYVTGNKAGTATITATSLDDNTKKASCTVTVLDKTIVNSISLDASDISLDIGNMHSLNDKVTPLVHSTTSWKSSDDSIASVDKYGAVTGKKEGTAIITATCGDKTASCTVHVTNEKAINFNEQILSSTVYSALSKAGLPTNQSGLPYLETLDAHGTFSDRLTPHYTFEDLSGIEALTGLKNLNLSYNRISDITPLKGLTKLETLELDNNDIKDVSALKDLKNLKSLTLSYNHTTPIANMEVLNTLPNLKELKIINGYVTDEDLQHIKAILPNCSITVQYK
ncbi:Ig-like domain-containing protein [Clostridium felsineum]|uniref:Ig-like domain-containing protein n=1 Tax=Clostridium felsineum TaxID=36839 RepID=UPI00098C0615|nr:Ig-like domain-containing protein [Clostridium felsineum]URZ14617.1 hypothetical protein CLFE_006140 [Clostridium felsineum DSM 794]